MGNLVDIVSTIIDKIDLDIKVDGIIDNSDGTFTISLCETKYLTLYKIIKSDALLEYSITAIEFGVSITVAPEGHSTDFAGAIVTMPKPQFIHGTPQTTNNEYLSLDNETAKKTPFIWLVETYSYDDPGGDSILEASYKVRLFFLDWANEEAWTNSEHNKFAIKPMEALKTIFMEVIEDSFDFRKPKATNIRVHPRFGVEIKDKGNKRKIINEDLTGIEARINLDLYDLSFCEC